MAELSRDWDKTYQELGISMEAKLEQLTNESHYALAVGTIERLEKESTILEAGCGVGQWVFLSRIKGYQAYGIDISEVAIEKAREAAKRRNLSEELFVIGDLRDLPYPNDFFDLIVSFGVVEHFANPEVALREFHRVLKPGGRVLVTSPNRYCFHGIVGKHVLNLTKSVKLGYVGYEDQYTPRTLTKLVQSAGFKAIESGLIPAGQVFGTFWLLIPLIGKPIFRALEKVSYFLETRTSTIGSGCYVIGLKTTSDAK